jgi:CRP-like cAMP-binding protein
VGVVILEGVLCRELALHDRGLIELLGPQDVLHPPVASDRRSLGGSVELTAVTDTVLIVLGEAFIAAAARWPRLLANVQRRLEAQRESFAIQALIAHLPRAEDRLLLMFWHLSERFGYVTPEGTALPIGLSHELLGRLIGTRRPTATLALKALESQGSIRRLDGGPWLLTAIAERRIRAIGHPPSAAQALGERLMLFGLTSKTAAEAAALRAEAKQIRASARARPTLRPSH